MGDTSSGWHMQLRVRGGKESEDLSFVDEDRFRDKSAGEWTTEMETERMLDEMIVMSGLVDDGEPFSTAEYSDLGLGVDLGLSLDMSTLSGWDMDAAVECIGAH